MSDVEARPVVDSHGYVTGHHTQETTVTSNAAPKIRPHDPATCTVCDEHGEVIVGWRPASMQVPPEAVYAPCPLASGRRAA